MKPYEYAVIGMSSLAAAEAGYLIWRQQQQQSNKEVKNQIILDTCALIDGRIIEIVRSGFVPGRLVIPQFVIAELQYLADYGDSQKRERARFGLDVIRELQDLRISEVVIARQQFADIKQVDDKLIALAKQLGAMLYTTDYNLNKVAQIEGVVVLNVNELAQALRPNHLPGERLEVKIVQTGQEKTQGVGHLDDGTMVVVERAGRKIGQKVMVELTRMLQTQAGKMIFAVLYDPNRGATNAPKPTAPAIVPKAEKPAAKPPVVSEPAQAHEQTATTPASLAENQQPARNQRQQKRFPYAKKRRPQSPEDALIKAVNNQ